jgi:hypothetical protein
MANFFTRKLGPLPVWAWGAVAVGGFVGYKLFFGESKSARATGGYSTDQYGNVYDANGNLVSPGEVPPVISSAPDVSMGTPIDSSSGGTIAPPAPVDLSGNQPPESAAPPGSYDQGYLDALTSAYETFGNPPQVPSTVPAPGPESPSLPSSGAPEPMSAPAGSLVSPSVSGAATPVPAVRPSAGSYAARALSTRTLPNGTKIYLLPSGAEVEQVPGKTPYQIRKPISAIGTESIAHPPAPHLSPPAPSRVQPGHSLSSRPAASAAVVHHYFTYKTQVKLTPGQTLHFAAGKGYYAA